MGNPGPVVRVLEMDIANHFVAFHQCAAYQDCVYNLPNDASTGFCEGRRPKEGVHVLTLIAIFVILAFTLALYDMGQRGRRAPRRQVTHIPKDQAIPAR